MAVKQVWRLRWKFHGFYSVLETEIEEYYREMLSDLQGRPGTEILFHGPVTIEVLDGDTHSS